VRAISAYCEEYSQKTCKTVKFHSADITSLKLDSGTKIHIFQIVEKWLNNIKKDADVSQVKISLVKAFSNICLNIQDNGKGFDTKQGLVHSKKKNLVVLQNIEKTVNSLKGQMKTYLRVGYGTIISIKFPYRKNNIPQKPHHLFGRKGEGNHSGHDCTCLWY